MIFPQGTTCPLVHSCNIPIHAGPQRRGRGVPRIPPALAPSQIPKNWEESYWNELGRLCQGIGTGDKGINKKRVSGTETLQVIQYKYVPSDRRKEVTYMKVVCEVLPQKDDPNRNRITIGGNIII